MSTKFVQLFEKMAVAGSPVMPQDDQADADFFEQLENDLSFSKSENHRLRSGPFDLSDCLEFEVPSPSSHVDASKHEKQEQNSFTDILAKPSIHDSGSALVISDPQETRPQEESNAIKTVGEGFANQKFERQASTSESISRPLDTVNGGSLPLDAGVVTIPTFATDAPPVVSGSLEIQPSAVEGQPQQQSESGRSIEFMVKPLELGSAVSLEKTDEGVMQDGLEPGRLVKEGSFAFAVSNGNSSLREDSCSESWSTFSRTDQLSSSGPGKLEGVQPESQGPKVQCQTAYKELQWSCFSDVCSMDDNGAFGSFPDLLSELGDKKMESKSVWDSGWKVDTVFSPIDWNETSGAAGEQLQQGSFDNLTEATEQANICYTSSHFLATDDTAHGQGQQAESEQHWENLYPGYYYDYNANEWRPIDGYDASVVSASASTMTDDQVRVKDESYCFPSAISEGGINYPSGTQAEKFEGHLSQGVSDSAVNQESAQQMNGWEAQYPGWRYDYQAQVWREISDGPEISDNSHRWQLGAEQSLHTMNAEGVYEYPAQDAEISSYQVLTAGSLPQSQSNVKGQEGQPEQQDLHTFQSYSKGWETFSYRSEKDHTQVGANGSYQQAPTSFSQPHRYAQTTTAPRNTSEAFGSSAGRPPHPLVSFGFGGKLVVMKLMQPLGLHGSDHQQVQSFNERNWTPVIYTLSKVVVESTDRRGRGGGTSYFTALNRQGFSGPLVGGTVSTKELLRWIDERAVNCEVEEPECTAPDELRVLWCLLKIACQNFGKLRSMVGSSGINSQVEDGPEVALGKLLASVKSKGSWRKGFGASCNHLQSVPSDQQLQATAIEMMNLLVVGKRKQALQQAQLGKLWGPALVLAWQLGEKFYADTVTLMAQQQFAPGLPLQTLCLLLAGQGTNIFSAKSQLPPSSAGGFYPVGVSYSGQDDAGGMLEDWQENLAIIAANRTKGDEQVIMHLGDCLWKAHGEVAGAHTCYLVAESNFEAFSGNARLCLVGADHFKYPRTFATPESIQRTELYEYAKVLGNPQFILLPFQPYKLVYAHMLAEAGKITEAIGYCQVVSKTLKNAGRVSEVEYCRQAAIELEDRLRLHSQSGYGLNLAPGKLVGKLISTIDSTIHKIIGGPPPPPEVQSNISSATTFGSYRSGDRMGNAPPSPLVPSASMEPISNPLNGKNYVDVPSRSISEPDFGKNPKQQETPSLRTSDNHSTESKYHDSREPSSSSYFGRFGSQILTKAVGFIRLNKKEAKLGEENKFYYDEKLKMWVEKGVEPPSQEVALPPPPTKFVSNLETSPSHPKSGAGTETQVSTIAGSSGPSLGTPPLPPSINQYSARGRLQGVRSRYVDTFNRGGSLSLSTKPIQSPAIPSVVPGSTSAPAKIFVPVPVSTSVAKGEPIQSVDGRRLYEGSAELVSKESVDEGYKETENELLSPRNLSSSLMAMPLMQRHSSADNVVKHASNRLLHGGGKIPDGNISRVVSWNGYSSSFEQVDKTPIVSTMGGGVRSLPSNGKNIGHNHLSNLAGFKDIKAGTINGSLPPPPLIEPPKLYMGMDSNMLSQTSERSALMQLPSGIPGGIYGEMQEVEL